MSNRLVEWRADTVDSQLDLNGGGGFSSATSDQSKLMGEEHIELSEVSVPMSKHRHSSSFAANVVSRMNKETLKNVRIHVEGLPRHINEGTRFIVFVIGLGTALSWLIQGMYTSPHVFYSNPITTMFIQCAIGFVVMQSTYHMWFSCPMSKLNKTARITSSGFVFGFLLMTNLRLPIPAVTAVLSAFTLSNYEKRIRGNHRGSMLCSVLVRLIGSGTLLLGTLFVTYSVMRHTQAGNFMWGHAKSEAFVQSCYAIAMFIFTLCVFATNFNRESKHHTAALIRCGFTGALAPCAVLFGASLLPEYSRYTTVIFQEGVLSSDDVASHISIVMFNGVFKLVFLACMIEAIQFGELFLFSGSAATGVMIFVVRILTDGHRHGLPWSSAVGVGLTCSGLVFMWFSHVLSRSGHRLIERDVRCKCSGTMAWHPQAWCNEELRRQIIGAAVSDDADWVIDTHLRTTDGSRSGRFRSVRGHDDDNDNEDVFVVHEDDDGSEGKNGKDEDEEEDPVAQVAAQAEYAASKDKKKEKEPERELVNDDGEIQWADEQV